MDPEDRKLIMEIHGAVHRIVPVLDAHGVQIGKLEDRTRENELGLVRQRVELSRAKSDLDGLGAKVRLVAAAKAAAPATPAPEGGSNHWLSFLELLVVVPKYAHALITLGSVAAMAALILWQHWPRGH